MRPTPESPYGLIDDGTCVSADGKIAWAGPADAVPSRYADSRKESLDGRLLTPSLIDCHTHLIFGGDRSDEFAMRLGGATYEDIARAGGGIMSTVRATRDATEDELLDASLARLDALMAEGVSVVEIKSGYGLNISEEMRMLRIARRLEEERNVKVLTTWLAAHALPPEYLNRADEYVDEIVIDGLSRAHAEGLVDAVDGFCETVGFTTRQIERVFEAATALQLPVKLHAEQLSDQGGALLAGRFNALSADHLEYLPPEDVPSLALTDTVAVLLPGAFYTLRESQRPPVDALREHGVSMAVATDCNPGSSPLTSILTAMNMSTTLFGLTPDEALAGVTRCAAKALGLGGSYGVIATGAVANLAVWDVAHPAELSYWIDGPPLKATIYNGELSAC